MMKLLEKFTQLDRSSYFLKKKKNVFSNSFSIYHHISNLCVFNVLFVIFEQTVCNSYSFNDLVNFVQNTNNMISEWKKKITSKES